MIRIVAFSDTHGQHAKVKVPDGDILIFAGDAMTSGYSVREMGEFLEWFASHPHEVKIMIAGNHDRIVEMMSEEFVSSTRHIFPEITYLENSGAEVGGIKIWGTPDTHEFCGWAFNRTHDQLLKSYAKIPEDTQILISHGPAYGILDSLRNGQKCGEPELLDRIKELDKLDLHIFGHIHEGRGYYPPIWANADHVNVTVVDEEYKLKHEPFVIDYDPVTGNRAIISR